MKVLALATAVFPSLSTLALIPACHCTVSAQTPLWMCRQLKTQPARGSDQSRLGVCYDRYVQAVIICQPPNEMALTQNTARLPAALTCGVICTGCSTGSPSSQLGQLVQLGGHVTQRLAVSVLLHWPAASCLAIIPPSWICNCLDTSKQYGS